jgi:hypothetical protein
MIGVVGNNVEHFLRCGQLRGKMLSVVGNNVEELPQRRTVKRFFLNLSLPLKRQFT